MTPALAVDLGRGSICANVIRPGIIPSGLRGSTEDEERARHGVGRVNWRQALDRIGHKCDIASAVVRHSIDAPYRMRPRGSAQSLDTRGLCRLDLSGVVKLGWLGEQVQVLGVPEDTVAPVSRRLLKDAELLE